MFGENSQKIRPVEGEMSAQSTSSERKAQVELKRWQLKQKVTIWSHFRMNQHTWKPCWSGSHAGVEEAGAAAAAACINIVSAFVWICLSTLPIADR